MYCQHCGKQVNPTANFCSVCGAAVVSQPVAFSGRQIVRPRSPRVIAGVCSGFAIYFGWNISTVRILFSVLTVVTSGIGILIYAAAWVILPEAQFALPASTNPYAGVPQSSPQTTAGTAI